MMEKNERLNTMFFLMKEKPKNLNQQKKVLERSIYGKILTEHEHSSSVNLTSTSHNTVAQVLFFLHAKVGTSVLHERAILDERSRINEQVNAFTSSQFAFLMLLIDSLLTAAQQCLLAFFLQRLFHIERIDHGRAQALHTSFRIRQARKIVRSQHQLNTMT